MFLYISEKKKVCTVIRIGKEGGGGGGGGILIQLLVYEIPASRPVFVAFPNPVFKLE